MVGISVISSMSIWDVVACQSINQKFHRDIVLPKLVIALSHSYTSLVRAFPILGNKENMGILVVSGDSLCLFYGFRELVANVFAQLGKHHGMIMVIGKTRV